MGVVVQLGGGQSSGVKCYGMDFSIGEGDRKGGCNSVVQGVHFNCNLCIWNPVSDYWSTSECLLDSAESIPAVVGEMPQSSFLGKVG